jgi:hypothetical protein
VIERRGLQCLNDHLLELLIVRRIRAAVHPPAIEAIRGHVRNRDRFDQRNLIGSVLSPINETMPLGGPDESASSDSEER